MSKIKYNTGYYPVIQKIEIEKETDSYVWIQGRRSAKTTSHEAYFDTLEEAEQHLITNADAKIKKCELWLSSAKEEKEKLIAKIAKFRLENE